MLNETGPLVIGQAVLDELARHLKLADPAPVEALVNAEAALRASIAHIEAELGLALVPRRFLWRTTLRPAQWVHLPMGPVREIAAAQTTGAAGTPVDFPVDLITLDQSGVHGSVAAAGSVSGPLEITFDAGFGTAWSDTPADLRHAVFMLAAHYFDTRHDVGAAGVETPHGVRALIAPWRPVRLTLGASK